MPLPVFLATPVHHTENIKWLIRSSKTVLQILAWKNNFLSDYFVYKGVYKSNHVLLRITATRPPPLANDEAQRSWAFSADGSFLTKSGYLLLNDNGYNKTDSAWQAIWKWKGPQSIKTFLWLLVHDKLKTRAELYKRHISSDTSCSRRGSAFEDSSYVLPNCIHAKKECRMVFDVTLWRCGIGEIKRFLSIIHPPWATSSMISRSGS